MISVEHKCWKIDCNSFSNATLQLSYVNLPGGELRRRCEDDERAMREYLIEGDLISVIFYYLNSKYCRACFLNDFF